MSLDYSTETLERIRTLARQGWPHGAVAAMVGWDEARLRRAVEKHGIAFWKIQAKSKTPDPVKANIRWDPIAELAWHGSKWVRLPPCEGRLFNAILKTGEYDWNVEKIAAVAEVPAKNVPAHISQLRGNLESIGLTLTRRTYEIERL